MKKIKHFGLFVLIICLLACSLTPTSHAQDLAVAEEIESTMTLDCKSAVLMEASTGRLFSSFFFGRTSEIGKTKPPFYIDNMSFSLL